MIGKLSGIIDSFASNAILLDVQGVGYLVHASARTLSNAGQAGDPLSLLIDTQVREDAITLYGFVDAAEQQWFRLLTSVQGVGAKAALAILSVLSPDKIQFAIMASDKAAITQADGVGPKLGTRIVTELKDKAGNIELTGSLKMPVQGKNEPDVDNTISGLDQDAVSALVNLGYSRSDAYSAVIAAKPKSNDNLQALIREALKALSA